MITAALAMAVYAAGAVLDIPWLRWVTKPVPILAMMAVLGRSTPYTRTVHVGLALSLVGDVLLMVPADLFIPGLLAFLLAHLAYTLAFSRGAPLRPVRLLGPAALGLGVGGVVLSRLTGPLVPAVTAYMLAIVVMAWRALARVEHWDARGKAELAGAAGAVLFLLSDATLAINKFVTPVPVAGLWIMGTYWAAQLGLTLSGVWQLRAASRTP